MSVAFIRKEDDMIEIITQKLSTYNIQTEVEEENALKEIMQEIALYALWDAGFFDKAMFQGGTSLRILHGLNRFSEDLDFILDKPDSQFDWNPYIDSLREVFEEYGIISEIISRENMDGNINRALIKSDSIANQLDLNYQRKDNRKKIKIKLEIDVNPPAYSGEAYSNLDFPLDHQIRHQDLPSNFALKIHALLCRPYLKGRDWYDFGWYVSQKIFPNQKHLEAALTQAGPWKNSEFSVTHDWLQEALSQKIESIDWDAAAKDVAKFLRPREAKSLTLWSNDFFQKKVVKLMTNKNV